MGDGLNGLAAAIYVASAVMLFGAAALLGFAGRLVADAARWTGARRRIAMFAGAATGAVLGVCLVTATFFETVWAPPPTLHFVVPAGFRSHWVILLDDRKHGRPIDWRGRNLPFLGRSATLVVPAGGVFRVASLTGLAGDGNVRATWSDGVSMIGFTGGRAPAASGATGFVAYEREHGFTYDPRDELPVEDDGKFTNYLARAEENRLQPHR